MDTAVHFTKTKEQTIFLAKGTAVSFLVETPPSVAEVVTSAELGESSRGGSLIYAGQGVPLGTCSSSGRKI
jgi:hypothetical protein